MPKPAKAVYVCSNCGYRVSGWMGFCPKCRAYNSFKEEEPSITTSNPKKTGITGGKALLLSEISAEGVKRIRTGIDEFDRALGGGIVPGSLILISGDPGIGKSTLMLQALASAEAVCGDTLYISGEESAYQIKRRASRLGITSDKLRILAETDMSAILKTIDEMNPSLIVVDSIQTVSNAEVDSAAGSTAQVRTCCMQLQRAAKLRNTAIIIVGHITKEGSIAGPKLLEHIVDTVLYFEGDNSNMYRVLRAVKNRFGPSNEIGVFEMKRGGLSQVRNPSERMIRTDAPVPSGSAIVPAAEGSRTILVELQSLVVPTAFGIPRRMSAGYDYNRLNMLLAVAEKRLGMSLGNQDVYVNVAGGLHLSEPACDLAILGAVLSSLGNIPISEKTVIFGEVGLTGELRGVSLAQSRVSEASRLGFKRIILPEDNRHDIENPCGCELVYCSTAAQALEAFW